jgi:hypothetical protein
VVLVTNQGVEFKITGATVLRIVWWLILVAGVLVLAGCDSKSNLEAPRKFFSKNKIGNSPDYAIIKWNNPDDHVVTVHGFIDDLKGCLLIAEALNKDACKETGGYNCLNPFSCQPLNH